MNKIKELVYNTADKDTLIEAIQGVLNYDEESLYKYDKETYLKHGKAYVKKNKDVINEKRRANYKLKKEQLALKGNVK